MRQTLAFNGRHWFQVVRFLTGRYDLRTGIVMPDEYGQYERRVRFGPYSSAQEAVSQ